MRLLLDTHIFLWCCQAPERLTTTAQRAITAPGNAIFVSAVVAWEIAIKHALGRLVFPVERFDELVETNGFETIEITTAQGIAAGSLPRHHDDPFDRLLIAQSRLLDLTLVTADRRFEDYGIKRL